MTQPFDPAGACAVVTGGASGIGLALAKGLKAAGAAHVIIADLDGEKAERVAAEIGGHAAVADVGDPEAVAGLIEKAREIGGEVDLYCSNAGVGYSDAPDWTAAGAPLETWEAAWRVNVMASVFAARHLLPNWIKRGRGHFLITASAAGILNQIGDAAYSATKHAAVGFAEAMAITHAGDGIGTTLLCPQGVKTPMIEHLKGGSHAVDGLLTAEEVAEKTLEGLREGRFLILPHEATRAYWQGKAADTDRWIQGMRRLRDKIIEDLGSPM